MHIGQLIPYSKSILTVLVQIDILPPGFKTLKISLNALSLFGARQKAPFEITTSIISSHLEEEYFPYLHKQISYSNLLLLLFIKDE